jgi:hypothetical protein
MPFRVFGLAARRRALPPRRRPLVESAARSECLSRPRSALYWFCAPASPSVLTPAVRSFADGLLRSQLSDRCTLSSSFAFLQSVLQRALASRSRSASASHGLSFPSAHQDSAIHMPRVLPRPATVRLQGLVTLLTAFARRTRVGLVSCRRRSWDSPFGVFTSQKVSEAFPPGRTHIPFLRPLYQSQLRDRPARSAAVSGLQPFREFLARTAGLAQLLAGYSPGFFPFRAFTATTLTGSSPGLLSRASQRRISHDSSRRRLRVSIGLRRGSSGATAASRDGRVSQPSWGFWHRLVPGHSDGSPPEAIFFACRRVAHYCRLTDCFR